MEWPRAGILRGPGVLRVFRGPQFIALSSSPDFEPSYESKMQKRSRWKLTYRLYQCQQEWRTQRGYMVTIWFPHSPNWISPLKRPPSGQRLLSKPTARGISGFYFQRKKRRGWVFLDLGGVRDGVREVRINCYSFVIHHLETWEQGSSSPSGPLGTKNINWKNKGSD